MPARLRRTVAGWFPDRRSLVLVFGSACFLTYTWTLLVSFWKFPSWLFFLNAGQLFSVYGYSFLIDLIEAVLLTGVVVFLRWVLPGESWRADFVPLSVITIGGIVAALNLWIRQYDPASMPGVFLDGPLAWAFLVPAALAGLGLLFHRIGFLKRAAAGFADRAVIFLYIYLPLTALSIVAVAVRAW
jgi:hypothetical protein